MAPVTRAFVWAARASSSGPSAAFQTKDSTEETLLAAEVAPGSSNLGDGVNTVAELPTHVTQLAGVLRALADRIRARLMAEPPREVSGTVTASGDVVELVPRAGTDPSLRVANEPFASILRTVRGTVRLRARTDGVLAQVVSVRGTAVAEQHPWVNREPKNEFREKLRDGEPVEVVEARDGFLKVEWRASGGTRSGYVGAGGIRLGAVAPATQGITGGLRAGQ
jgi:hypothetical protein